MSGDHARRMDAIYATQRHFYDLTRKYYLLGRDSLIRDLAPPPGGAVLEVGCGTARNLIAAAKYWPDARFFGFDISEAMLATARRNVAKAALSDRITLAQGDATDFDAPALFGIARFERVFLSYTLSMIPGWQAAIRQAVAVGDKVLIVDFGQQERLPRLFRSALFAWLGHFDVTPRAELYDAAAAAGLEGARPVRVERLYRGYAWRAVIG
ncbi:class I SAM-dependent methyltransferase [Stakelama saccharophila]|uniref:Class I SAM-dependent methyltransferase n=1 Tax=Stakelama saccharophila TaxID=3075605 RepID=A0ABZ0BCD3_9SPHN|nr:class I SAM-dependent methyltransferase [Stakelama sp. W311]WNO54721.1 class I SAM-dependent methyltransferase [Stakelama sp. W311]